MTAAPVAHADDLGTNVITLTRAPRPVALAPVERARRPFTRALSIDRRAACLLAAFVVFVFIGQSMRSTVPDHGDWWTDMAVQRMTERIDMEGAWATRFALPLDDGFPLGVETTLYANWPSATFQVQALARGIGLQPSAVRLISLIETALAAHVLFCFARLVAGRRTATFSLLLFLTAAPIRLLADSFGYVPVDLLGRVSAFLLVAITCGLDPHRQRRAWLFGLAASSLAITANAVLLGFESFPAACVFAAGYPLIRAGRSWVERRRAIAVAVLVPAVGIAGAAVGRLSSIALLPGPFGEDLARVRASANVRLESSGFENSLWTEWSQRIWSYMPILLVLALLGVAVAVVEGVVHRRHGRMLLGGLLVLLAEGAWAIVVREHGHSHVHTIALLACSLVLPAGWLLDRATRSVSTTTTGRVAVTAAAVLGTLALLQDPGVHPYGNVTGRIDWSAAEEEVARIRADLPADAAVGLFRSVVDSGPVVQFLIERPSLLVPNRNIIEVARARPTVLIFRRGVEDPAVGAAFSAGATLVLETPNYGVLRFDDPGSIPTAIDPDG